MKPEETSIAACSELTVTSGEEASFKFYSTCIKTKYIFSEWTTDTLTLRNGQLDKLTGYMDYDSTFLFYFKIQTFNKSTLFIFISIHPCNTW